MACLKAAHSVDQMAEKWDDQKAGAKAAQLAVRWADQLGNR